MKLVAISSPYSGNVGENVTFALEVCWYALQTGYAPFAPHLLYTQMLDDSSPSDRILGHDAGLYWGMASDEVWFCLLEGLHSELSPGMRQELAFYEPLKPCHFLLFRFAEITGDINFGAKEYDDVASLHKAAREAWLDAQPS